MSVVQRFKAAEEAKEEAKDGVGVAVEEGMVGVTEDEVTEGTEGVDGDDHAEDATDVTGEAKDEAIEAEEAADCFEAT